MCKVWIPFQKFPFSEQEEFLTTNTDRVRFFFNRRTTKNDKSLVDFIGNVFRSKEFCENKKCVHVPTWKAEGKNCYGCLHCKALCHVFNVPFKDPKL